LRSEQLAGFIGYSIKDVAKALDAFFEAGLLERTAPQSRHAARMFFLLLDAPQGRPVKALLELASTREGRQTILEALNAPESRPIPWPHLKMQRERGLAAKAGESHA
jgi:hypothetical protein